MFPSNDKFSFWRVLRLASLDTSKKHIIDNATDSLSFTDRSIGIRGAVDEHVLFNGKVKPLGYNSHIVLKSFLLHSVVPHILRTSGVEENHLSIFVGISYLPPAVFIQQFTGNSIGYTDKNPLRTVFGDSGENLT